MSAKVYLEFLFVYNKLFLHNTLMRVILHFDNNVKKKSCAIIKFTINLVISYMNKTLETMQIAVLVKVDNHAFLKLVYFII